MLALIILIVFALGTASGIMIGRVVGTKGKILKILEDQGII